MGDFIQGILSNAVSGFVEAGTRTVGQYAGDALIKAGDLIEEKGASLGTSVEHAAASYGAKIAGNAPPKQLQLPSSKQPKLLMPPPTKSSSQKGGQAAAAPALPKPGYHAAKAKAQATRSSQPMNSKKPVASSAKPGPNANGQVYPWMKHVSNSTPANKAVAVKKNVPATATARPKLKVNARTGKPLPRPFDNSVSLAENKDYVSSYHNPASASAGKKGASSVKSSVAPSSNSKPAMKTAAKQKANSSAQRTPYPYEQKFGAKSAAGRAGGAGGGDKKPYPGTHTLPGEGSRTPVKKYKPLERMKPPAEYGKVEHIPIAV